MNERKEYYHNYYLNKRKNKLKVNARNLSSIKLKHLKRKGYEFHHLDYHNPLNILILPIEEHRKLHSFERRCAMAISNGKS